MIGIISPFVYPNYAIGSSTWRTSGSPTRRPALAAATRWAKQERHKPATATQLKNDAALVSLLRNAVEAASDEDGWAPLAAVGNILTNQRPDFDSRNYGYGKLSDLISATTLFEIERRSPGDGKQELMYAREKRRASATRKAAATRSGGTRSTGTRSAGTRTAKAAS
jgi:hypothetical protein